MLSVPDEPVRARILFAGTADLRKGIHYLAMASEKLVEQGFHYEFRIAGDVEHSVANQRECRYLTFLGRVPRAGMTREFASADLFVLPALAEGWAEARSGALACGGTVV